MDGTDRKEAEVMERDRWIELRLVMSADTALVGAVLRALQTRLDALNGAGTKEVPSGGGSRGF